MIYINLLLCVYIPFLHQWLILNAHCKLLIDVWDFNQVFILMFLSDLGIFHLFRKLVFFEDKSMSSQKVSTDTIICWTCNQ